MRIKLEVCVDSFESAANAVHGGCDRLEVCSALSLGGLTPSAGLIAILRANFPEIPLMAMLRPRAANFVYNPEEIEIILCDLKILKDAGATGFVFGALTREGDLDVITCAKVLAAAGERPVTFHRAIDVCSNWKAALDTAISLGFKSVLTSGQKQTAVEGATTIKEMQDYAGEKVDVLVGSGVKSSVLKELASETGCSWFHASASIDKILEGNVIAMGALDCEVLQITSVDEVRRLKQNIEM